MHIEISHYRGRFAPTPSGPLHFGSMVAAVGSFLDARSRGGTWLVRIDDLDPPRTVPGAAGAILRCLDAFGMHWDGEVVYQSTRSDAYHAALHQLQQSGRTYPCACSRKEISDAGLAGVDGAVYPGTCRNGLARLESEARAIAGSHRRYDDRVRRRIAGKHVLQNLAGEVGDFVLLPRRWPCLRLPPRLRRRRRRTGHHRRGARRRPALPRRRGRFICSSCSGCRTPRLPAPAGGG